MQIRNLLKGEQRLKLILKNSNKWFGLVKYRPQADWIARLCISEEKKNGSQQKYKMKRNDENAKEQQQNKKKTL